MSNLLTDVRLAVRLLVRQPGLALTAIVALAMGIGFTTSMFGIVHGGTRALPVDEPHEVAAFLQVDGRGRQVATRPLTFRHWQATLTSLEGLAAWRNRTVNVSGGGEPDRMDAAELTPNALTLLGTPAAKGRVFTESDAAPGAPLVALVSDDVWRNRFHGDPDIVGLDIRLNGVPHTIVGVMPRRFGFPINMKIWTPLGVEPTTASDQGNPLQVFGRLKDAVTLDRAQNEASLALSRLASEQPALAGHGARVLPYIELETPREVQRGLQVLVLAVSLAFLVACANVANLLLARAAARTRDTALRTALGAGRARLVRQAIIETVLLSGVACALGLGLAFVGLRYFASAVTGILDGFWVDFRVDATVVMFATSLALLASLATSLVPALRATRGGPAALLQAHASNVAGLRIGRLSRALVIAQIALACGLFALTATFVRAAVAIRAVEFPFPVREILTTTLGVPSRLAADPSARRALLLQLKTSLSAVPGVGQTAFTSVLPGRGGGNDQVALIAAPREPADMTMTSGVGAVTPEFFALAGVGEVPGRLLTWQDDWRSAPVAVVNHSFVRKFSPDREVIGRLMRVGQDEFTIVGVVPDLLMQDVQDRDGSGVYVSLLQVRPYVFRTMTRTGANPMAAFPALRAAIHGVSPDLPVLEPTSLHDAIYADKRVLDAMAALFLAFGAGTVFLAVIGLFGVLSFVVTARVREFGVRLALGASPRDLASLVLARGARDVGLGLALGLALAFAISRALAATLENVPAAGTGVFAMIAVAVAATAALALWTPVARAAHLSATDALRD